MDQKIFEVMMDIVKGRGSKREQVIFVTQLLTLGKLAKEGKIEQKLDIFDLKRNATKTSVKELFEELSKLEVFKQNQQVSLFDSSYFDELTDKDIESLFRTLGWMLDLTDFNKIAETIICWPGLEKEIDYFSLPTEVAELMVELGTVYSDRTVYCPFNTSLKLAFLSSTETKNVFVEVQTQDPLPYLLNLLKGSSIKIRVSDPVLWPSWTENGQLTQFDVTLAYLPVGKKYNKDKIKDIFERFPEESYYSEVLYIRHILAQMREKAILLISNNILSRTSGGERSLKEDLVNKGWLSKIIALPPDLFPSSNNSFSLVEIDKSHIQVGSTHVLCFNAHSENYYEKKAKSKIVGSAKNRLKNSDEIVDLVTNFYGYKTESRLIEAIEYEECRKNNYNLLVEQYIASSKAKEKFGEATVKLEQIATIIKAQSVPNEDIDDATMSNEKSETFFEVAPSDINSDGYVLSPKKKVVLNNRSLIHKIKQQFLKANDLLIVIKGGVGNIGIIHGDYKEENNWIAGQSFVILRLDASSGIKAEVLYNYLSSTVVQQLLSSSKSGGTVPFLPMNAIKNLEVVILPMQKQEQILEKHAKVQELYSDIELIRSQIIGLKKDIYSNYFD